MVSFKGRKSKGTGAERELLRMFWNAGWAGIRCAGSGSARTPSPDLVVGNSSRMLALEVKTTKDEKKYLTKKEVEELREFAKRFGAHPMIAVKLRNKEWFFISVQDLHSSEKSYSVNPSLLEKKGLGFQDLIKI